MAIQARTEKTKLAWERDGKKVEAAFAALAGRATARELDAWIQQNAGRRIGAARMSGILRYFEMKGQVEIVGFSPVAAEREWRWNEAER